MTTPTKQALAAETRTAFREAARTSAALRHAPRVRCADCGDLTAAHAMLGDTCRECRTARRLRG